MHPRIEIINDYIEGIPKGFEVIEDNIFHRYLKLDIAGRDYKNITIELREAYSIDCIVALDGEDAIGYYPMDFDGVKKDEIEVTYKYGELYVNIPNDVNITNLEINNKE